ncbi:MAG: orotidine-5'-phosphate decarboxylase, partial [Gammaproteobacteria bacterium]|nr:orotidine-5'-phosphate decarboxylase [Gammaproteobacteria bacterium]
DITLPIGRLKNMGKKVFLDLKLYDIETTIHNTVSQLANLGVDMLTVHGDPAIVTAAVKANTNSSMKILATTVLSSYNTLDLYNALMVRESRKDLIIERAKRAIEAGADGLICPTHALTSLKHMDTTIVCPGIRLEKDLNHDHIECIPPHTALENGANYLVLGRPITSNPTTALSRFKEYTDDKP